MRLHLAQHECASRHHHFFVGECDVAAGPDGRESRRQPHRTNQSGDHEICRVFGNRLQSLVADEHFDWLRAEALAQLGGPSRVGDRHEPGVEAANLIGQFFDVAPRPERNHFEALGRGRGDGQGLFANRSGTSEQREPLAMGSISGCHLSPRAPVHS